MFASKYTDQTMTSRKTPS